MRRSLIFLPFLSILITSFLKNEESNSWIRINLLGYKPASVKVAIWCSKEKKTIKTFQLIDAATKKIAFRASARKPFGAYGPFTETYRLNFSSFKKPGSYYIQAGGAKSPLFQIGEDVYKGSADFCLRYM